MWAIQQPEFAIFDQAVGIFEVGQAVADGFDLGASQERLRPQIFPARSSYVKRSY